MLLGGPEGRRLAPRTASCAGGGGSGILRADRLKRRVVIILVVVLLVGAGAAVWVGRDRVEGWLGRGEEGLPVGVAVRPRPDDYQMHVEDARRWRADLAARHRGAGDEAARGRVLGEARQALETLLPAMMRCWLGTPWGYDGTAEAPGAGDIACGYFVATVLRDAGFRIDRFKVAKEPSETILRTFLPRKALRYRVGVPYAQFAAEARQSEPGVYIIGLDTHVAFLVVAGGSFRMIHASGSRPWRVVEEPETGAPVLANSRFRVLGNLTADRELLQRWLLERPLPVGAR